MPFPALALTDRQRADLYFQLARLETAGLPAAQAAKLVKLSAGSAFSKALQAFHHQLLAGDNPAAAGEYCGIFSGFDAALLRAAMVSGDSARMYRRLAEHYAGRAKRAALVKSRLLLPAAMLVFTLFIQALPDLLLGVIDGFDYLRRTLSKLLALLAIAYWGRQLPRWLRENKWPALKPACDALCLKLPLFGPMQRRRNLAVFFASLAMLLEAGVPAAEAARTALATVHNQAVRRQFAGLPAAIAGGASLADALKNPPFPGNPGVLNLIATGEASGRLPDTLRRYAATEEAALASFDAQLAEWLPRLVYLLAVAIMASALLGSKAFMPSA